MKENVRKCKKKRKEKMKENERKSMKMKEHERKSKNMKENRVPFQSVHYSFGN